MLVCIIISILQKLVMSGKSVDLDIVKQPIVLVRRI